ncbi:type II secretion system protein, partial [sediment metagenome]
MAQVVATQQFPFLYEGVDKKGQKVKGRILAASELAVKTDLRKQGIIAKKVRKQSQLLKGNKKIDAGDIALFARQLATMLQAGIPMVQAFDIVGNGHEKPAMQKLILSIKGDVESGTTLHEALAKHPLYFDDL